jgi:hypothetical protein
MYVVDVPYNTIDQLCSRLCCPVMSRADSSYVWERSGSCTGSSTQLLRLQKPRFGLSCCGKPAFVPASEPDSDLVLPRLKHERATDVAIRGPVLQYFL